MSLVVALVMSVAAWRLMRDEKQRSAARVAALSVAARQHGPIRSRLPYAREQSRRDREANARRGLRRSATRAASIQVSATRPNAAQSAVALRIVTLTRRSGVIRTRSGFLGATEIPRDAAAVRNRSRLRPGLFVGDIGRAGVDDVGPEGTLRGRGRPELAARAVSLTTRVRTTSSRCRAGSQSGDRQPSSTCRRSCSCSIAMGTFVTSSRANVDFLKLSAGDDAVRRVARRAGDGVALSREFRTDEGIVPHIDRRSASPRRLKVDRP